MPRRSVPSTSLPARVRQWFGLTQAQLALYLGSSQTLLQAIETDQRRLLPDLAGLLLPLAAHLPPLPSAAPSVPPAATEAPEVAALLFRHRQCQAQARRLATELAALETTAAVAARWAAARPSLLAEVPPPLPGSSPAEAAARETWRQDWLSRQARPRPAAEATRAALLRARLAGLAAEAAALAEVTDL